MKTEKTPRTPYCAECGGTDVQITAWIEWRPDGTERVAGSTEDGDEGNWCPDCEDHTEIVFPTIEPEWLKEEWDARRELAEAAREHAPQLLKLLEEILEGNPDKFPKARLYVESLRRKKE